MYIMKVGIVISYILKALMVVLILIAAVRGQWALAISGTLALLLCMLPAFISRRYDVALPLALDILITLALLIHIGGEVTRAYFILPHYDTIAHFTSGALVAFMAFIVIYVLDQYWDGLTMDLYVMVFFVIITAMAMGVVWEFMEWTSDLYLGTWAQRGNQDTMGDLFLDTLAAIIVAVGGVLLVKRGEMGKMTNGLGKFVDSKARKKKL
jgi:uncharacterized membrane protein YjdF